MTNEYENDPDELSIPDDMKDALVELAKSVAEAEESSTGLSGTPVLEAAELIEPDSILWEAAKTNIIDSLERSKFETDKVVYDITNYDGVSYDNDGFLSPNFNFSFKKISEVVNGRLALDTNSMHNGNIAIYKDTIEDKVSTGGGIASGEFVVYSSCGGTRSGEPAVGLLPQNSETETFFDAFFHKTDVRYVPEERQGFYLKYAAISASVGELNADSPTSKYLNDIFDEMALDIYNTVLSREYVPKMILQEDNNFIDSLNTSIGSETEPSAETIFNTETYEYEEI